MDSLELGIINGGRAARQRDAVAVFEIGDGIGEGSERDRIRAQIHFALAIADRQWCAEPCADNQIVFARKQETQRKRATQLSKAGMHSLNRVEATPDFMRDEM